MSRFILTTTLAIVAASILALTLGDPARTYAVIGVWVVYLSICLWGTVRISSQFYCRAICTASRGAMRVALTFDDGPDPNSTPALLELLSREQIPAAFFCIGKNVDAHPEVIAQIAAGGHLLANHTYRHPWWICFLGTRGLANEMLRTQEALHRAAAVTPKYMRSPMGLTNPHFSGALRKVGLTLVGWDVRSFDTKGNVPGAINRIARQTRDGSIILLHDGGVPADQLLKIVSHSIALLRARGFGFERLDRLIDQAGKSTTPIGNSPAR